MVRSVSLLPLRCWHRRILDHLDHFLYHLMHEARQYILKDLTLNPGPLTLQATTLTPRPWFQGQGYWDAIREPRTFHSAQSWFCITWWLISVSIYLGSCVGKIRVWSIVGYQRELIDIYGCTKQRACIGYKLGISGCPIRLEQVGGTTWLIHLLLSPAICLTLVHQRSQLQTC